MNTLEKSKRIRTNKRIVTALSTLVSTLRKSSIKCKSRLSIRISSEIDKINSGLTKEDNKTAVDKIELSYPPGTPISNYGYEDLPSPRTYMVGSRSQSAKSLNLTKSFKERVDFVKALNQAKRDISRTNENKNILYNNKNKPRPRDIWPIRTSRTFSTKDLRIPSTKELLK